MSQRDTAARLDWLNRMQEKLNAMANEMDDSQDPAMEAMAEHLDCINDEVQFQIDKILEAGPVVAFKDGKFSKYTRQTHDPITFIMENGHAPANDTRIEKIQR